jgi:plastocyanin
MAIDRTRDLPGLFAQQEARARWRRVSRPRWSVVRAGMVLAVMVAVTACGGALGNPAASAPTDRCWPNGAILRITVRNNQFDQECLAVAANTSFSIVFDNQDRGVPHNLAIYAGPQRSRTLFKGRLIEGARRATYRVGRLPAGMYYFQCDVHPQSMHGTFVVAEAQ